MATKTGNNLNPVEQLLERKAAKRKQQSAPQTNMDALRAFDRAMNPGLTQQELQEANNNARQQDMDALRAFDRAMNPGLTQQQLQDAAINNARRQEEKANRELEEYRQSSMRQKAWYDVVYDALKRSDFGIGSLGPQSMGLSMDQKEAELAAKAAHYKQQREDAEAMVLMAKDMAVINAMPAEDQALLARYVAGHNEWMNYAALADANGAMAELSKKYGMGRIRELAESYERYRNQVLSQGIAEMAWKPGDGLLSAVGQSAATVAANTIGSFTAPVEYLAELAGRTGRYPTLDPNNEGTFPGQYAANVRQNVAGNIKGEGGLGRNLLALGYEGIMATADTAARIFVAGGSGTGSLGLAALGSFGSTVSEASAQGASPAQAVLLGTAKAGIEVLTEKMSVDELFRAGKSGADSAGKIIRNVLRQGGIEATEEEISMLGGLAAEAVILQEKNSYSRRIGDLVADGMSYQEAKDQANRELWNEAANTAVRSFISGSAMEGARAAGSYLLNRGTNAPDQAAPEPAVPAEPTPEATPDDGLAKFREAADELLRANDEPGDDSLMEGYQNEEELMKSVSEAAKDAPEETPQKPKREEEPEEKTAPERKAEPDNEPEAITPDEEFLRSMDEYIAQRRDQAPEENQAEPEELPTEEPPMEQLEDDEPQPETVPDERQPEPLQPMGNEPEENLDDGAGEPEEEPEQQPGRAFGRPHRDHIRNPEEGQLTTEQAIERYGAIPAGERPAREGQLPISTNGEDHVSYTARTAREAQATTDEFAQLIDRETMRGRFSFVPIRNSDTVRRATAEIRDQGWERSLNNWTAEVRAGRTSPELTAVGALLYNNAVNSGNTRQALDILTDYQYAVRNAAQAVQAARILKTLTPNDRLYMMRTSVRRMVQDMGLENSDIQIDKKLARQYQEAEDNETADRVLDEIVADVARQIPPTLAERITALRYLNMLGNFRTQIRNVAGNVGARLTYLAKDEVGATIEAVASWVSGGRFQRTKVHLVDRTTRQAAAADYENVSNWVEGGGRYNDTNPDDEFQRRVQEARRILPPGLEHYRRATNWAMNNEYFGDAAFGRGAYARALAGFLNARGIRTDNLNTVDPDILDQAREYAVRQAQEATFRDNNQISDLMSRFARDRRNPAWVRVIGEGILPFRKTPANVLVRAEEFSPLGLINSVVNSVRASRGEITGADLVDSWAKSLTGSALFILGMGLFDMGFLRAGPDEDKEKAAFDRMNGYQNYAIMLPDGENFTIDFLSPAAMPMLLGAQMQQVIEDKDLTWGEVSNVLLALSDPMIEMSMLQGLNDTINGIRYAENGLGQLAVDATLGYLTQALGNTLLGQLERSTENVRMTTWIDKNSSVPAWLQRNLGQLSQKVPIWDFQQTPYIDEWGREQENIPGLGGLAYNTLSPSYIDKAQEDDVSRELNRLHESLGTNSVFPKHSDTTVSYTDTDGNRHENYHMTMEQEDKFKRTEGQTKRQIVEGLIASDAFKSLPDKLKEKALLAAYDYAREYARGQVLPGYDGMANWMKNIQGTEADAILKKVVDNNLTDAMGNLTEAWKNGYSDDSTAMDDLEAAYQTFSGLSSEEKEAVMEDLPEKIRGYIEAREAGETAENLIPSLRVKTISENALDNLREAIKEGKAGPEQIDALDAVYREYSGLSEEARAAYLESSEGGERQFLAAKDAGVDTGAFTQLYSKYKAIDEEENTPKATKALEWAYVLHKAAEAGQITEAQADIMQDTMRYWSQIPAEPGKYMDAMDAGFTAEDARQIIDTIAKVSGTGSINEETGKATVRNVDKYEAIGDLDFLSEEEMDNAMKMYMPDYDPEDEKPDLTELRYEYARRKIGLTAAEFADAYRVITDGGKKEEMMDGFRELGFLSKAEAEKFWKLYNGTGKNKIDVEAWWDKRPDELR